MRQIILFLNVKNIYFKMQLEFITNYVRCFIAKCNDFILKCDNYYKPPQLY